MGKHTVYLLKANDDDHVAGCMMFGRQFGHFMYLFIYLIFIYLFDCSRKPHNEPIRTRKIRTCHNQVINCSESSTRGETCTMAETGQHGLCRILKHGQHGLCRILKHETTYISTWNGILVCRGFPPPPDVQIRVLVERLERLDPSPRHYCTVRNNSREKD